MAEKDRFTLSREQAAAKVRSKVTGFDFADSARANMATAKVLGDVASSLADKTEEQNRRFDKLLKILDFLPKDQLERRKQQKEVFVHMAQLTAIVEREAKNTPITDPLKKMDLFRQARALRQQGRQFGSDYNSNEARGLKENFAERFLKISPQKLRAGGGIFGAYSDEIDRITGFKKLAGFVTGKRDDAFGRQVEQERLFPALSLSQRNATREARKRGNITDTNEKGLDFTKRGESTGKRAIGVSYGPILRQMTGALIEIRDAVTGKHGSTAIAPTEGMEPKGLLTPEQKDLMDPRNWGVKKKGSQKGRKFWNKRDSSGRVVKPGSVETIPPDEPNEMTFDEFQKKKKRSRVQKDFDKDFDKNRFGSSGNDQGKVEGEAVGGAAESSEGLLGGVGGSVEGGMGSLLGEAAGGAGIAGAVGAALPEIITAILAAGAIAIIGTAVYKWWHSNDKPTDKTSATTGPNGSPWQSPTAFGGTVTTNGTVETPTSMTGDTIEQQMKYAETPHIVAPTINHITNNNGGSGGSSSSPGMPSVRTTDPSFVRWQDRRQSRVF